MRRIAAQQRPLPRASRLIWGIHGNAEALFSGDFMPHGFCYLWNPRLVGLHVVSDTLIGISYLSIPVTLFYFSRKRRDAPFSLDVRVLWNFRRLLRGDALHGSMEHLERRLLDRRSGEGGHGVMERRTLQRST